MLCSHLVIVLLGLSNACFHLIAILLLFCFINDYPGVGNLYLRVAP
jgi:hypothetical protein